MSKEQRKYENQICKCGHRRFTHSGTTEVCYHPECECMKFEQKSEN